MSNLLLPNQTQIPIGVLTFPGDNAVPVSASFGANGSITVACVGGLTKRQELAARFFETVLMNQLRCQQMLLSHYRICGISRELPDVNDTIGISLAWADALLASTENAAPSPADNPPV